MALDHFAIIYNHSPNVSTDEKSVKTVLIWEKDQLRVVTNSAAAVRAFTNRCDDRSPSWTQRILPDLWPLGAMLHGGWMQMNTYSEVFPMGETNAPRLAAALDELGRPAHDEVVYPRQPTGDKGKP